MFKTNWSPVNLKFQFKTGRLKFFCGKITRFKSHQIDASASRSKDTQILTTYSNSTHTKTSNSKFWHILINIFSFTIAIHIFFAFSLATKNSQLSMLFHTIHMYVQSLECWYMWQSLPFYHRSLSSNRNGKSGVYKENLYKLIFETFWFKWSLTLAFQILPNSRVIHESVDILQFDVHQIDSWAVFWFFRAMF